VFSVGVFWFVAKKSPSSIHPSIHPLIGPNKSGNRLWQDFSQIWLKTKYENTKIINHRIIFDNTLQTEY
jgi:hypothetical protein